MQVDQAVWDSKLWINTKQRAAHLKEISTEALMFKANKEKQNLLTLRADQFCLGTSSHPRLPRVWFYCYLLLIYLLKIWE